VLSWRTTLDDDMIGAAYQQLLAEKGLTDDAAASVPTIEITGAPSDDAPSLRLLRIGDTSRVNRLIDGQEIGFNDRLTVVYGENASGKAGYARVLKRVAGARSAGRLLPVVYTSSPGTPTATIEYSLGSDTETVAWHEGSSPVPVLTSIDGVDFDECVVRAVDFDVAGNVIPVIGLDDLKANKLASGRSKDLADLDNLP